jgi:hypothetical protein
LKLSHSLDAFMVRPRGSCVDEPPINTKRHLCPFVASASTANDLHPMTAGAPIHTSVAPHKLMGNNHDYHDYHDKQDEKLGPWLKVFVFADDNVYALGACRAASLAICVEMGCGRMLHCGALKRSDRSIALIGRLVSSAVSKQGYIQIFGYACCRVSALKVNSPAWIYQKPALVRALNCRCSFILHESMVACTGPAHCQ